MANDRAFVEPGPTERFCLERTVFESIDGDRESLGRAAW